MTKFRGNVLRITTLAILPMAASLCQAQTSGKDTFTAKCVMCHAADGTGSSTGKTLKVPNLRTSLIQKKGDAKLTQVIAQGKANMPAFGTALSDDEMKDVPTSARLCQRKNSCDRPVLTSAWPRGSL